MYLDKINEFLSTFDKQDLPAGGAGLVAIILLFLVFKARRATHRFLLFLIAIGLFAGAWWWHTHKAIMNP
jgi:hypothetical protein